MRGGTALLLREANDAYEQALALEGWTPAFVPVIEDVAVGADALARILAAPEQFDGVIVTSQRAVAQLARAADALCLRGWLARTVYAVGPETAAAVVALGFARVVGGPAAPNAAALVQLVAAPDNGRSHVFFCGERRASTIRDWFAAREWPLREIVVYSTAVRHGFRAELHNALDRISPKQTSAVALFSPAGAEAAEPVLRDAGKRAPPTTRLVAIGPTTAAALPPDWAVAIAAEPTPAAMAAALGPPD